jgi:hypothetical protein
LAQQRFDQVKVTTKIGSMLDNVAL